MYLRVPLSFDIGGRRGKIIGPLCLSDIPASNVGGLFSARGEYRLSRRHDWIWKRRGSPTDAGEVVSEAEDGERSLVYLYLIATLRSGQARL